MRKMLVVAMVLLVGVTVAEARMGGKYDRDCDCDCRNPCMEMKHGKRMGDDGPRMDRMERRGDRDGRRDGPMEEMMPPGLRHACKVDLAELGLSEPDQKRIEEKRFAVRKQVMRGMAELKILRMENDKLIEDRLFDLKAAQDNAAKAAKLEAELRAAHLGLMKELADSLDDAGWEKFRTAKQRPMRDGDDRMMRRTRDGSGDGPMHRRLRDPSAERYDDD